MGDVKSEDKDSFTINKLHPCCLLVQRNNGIIVVVLYKKKSLNNRTRSTDEAGAIGVRIVCHSAVRFVVLIRHMVG